MYIVYISRHSLICFRIGREIINLATYCSIALQPSQPLLHIINFMDTRIGVLTRIEELFVVLYGFRCVALLSLDFAEHVEALGVNIAIINSARPHNKKEWCLYVMSF